MTKSGWERLQGNTNARTLHTLKIGILLGVIAMEMDHLLDGK